MVPVKKGNPSELTNETSNDEANEMVPGMIAS